MKHCYIVGQSPARSGDGTPFSGASGRRLSTLAGVEWIGDVFELRNLIPHKPARMASGGDEYDRQEAALGVERIWAERPRLIIMCGNNVARSFGLARYQLTLFHGFRRQGAELWLFPHPSGTSRYWNDPESRERAERFLKSMVRRAASFDSHDGVPSL